MSKDSHELFGMVSESLAQVLEELSIRTQITPETRILDDLGVDSLQVINFLLEIEDRIGVEIDFTHLQVEDLQTVDAFLQYLDRLKPAV